MTQPPFEAYTGTGPYIFISYAHKDAESVFPLINEWHTRGYRIWYDEGIDPGNEWPEEVANALKKCSQFIVFISPRAVKSKNVKNEINYALNMEKDFIAIHMEETGLPAGLELRMGDIQAIMKYRMPGSMFDNKMKKVLVKAARQESPGKSISDEKSENIEEEPGLAADLETEDGGTEKDKRPSSFSELKGHIVKDLFEVKEKIKKEVHKKIDEKQGMSEADKIEIKKEKTRKRHRRRKFGLINLLILIGIGAALYYYFGPPGTYNGLVEKYLSMDCPAYKSRQDKARTILHFNKTMIPAERKSSIKAEIKKCEALTPGMVIVKQLNLETKTIEELEHFYLNKTPEKNTIKKKLVLEYKENLSKKIDLSKDPSKTKILTELYEDQYRKILITLIKDSYEK